MKTAEAINPAVPAEDMAQPMGPLEHGDQALVDAVAEIPEGEHRVSEHGRDTQVLKTTTPDRDILTTQTLNRDGTWEETSASVSRATPHGNIGASINEQPTVRGKEYSTYTDRDRVGENMEPAVIDRKRAQQEKAAIALRIKAASKRLGDMSVEAAGRQE